MLQVSGLPVPTTESDLNELFSDYGKIQIIRIDIKNDQSIAIVQLDNDEDERDAKTKLDKRPWRGSHIYVETFRGQIEKLGDPRSGGTNRSGGTKNKDAENKGTGNKR